MEEKDEAWIKEELVKKTNLPEAPLSIHVDSYIDGFHVGWTKRMGENSLAPQIISIKGFVKMLKEHGFMPSWNQQTNEQVTKTNGNDWCSIHQEKMKQYTKGTDSWYSHKVDEDTWCNGGKKR